jgi:hypothetical protein
MPTIPSHIAPTVPLEERPGFARAMQAPIGLSP